LTPTYFEIIEEKNMSILSTIKSVLATWNSPSGTSWVNNWLRDQPLHLLYGSACGLIASDPYAGVAVASMYGAIREGEQWGTLKTPSLKDSLIDWSFVTLGGVLGAVIRHYVFK
jgi:hypothetical protein